MYRRMWAEPRQDVLAKIATVYYKCSCNEENSKLVSQNITQGKFKPLDHVTATVWTDDIYASGLWRMEHAGAKVYTDEQGSVITATLRTWRNVFFNEEYLSTSEMRSIILDFELWLPEVFHNAA